MGKINTAAQSGHAHPENVRQGRTVEVEVQRKESSALCSSLYVHLSAHPLWSKGASVCELFLSLSLSLIHLYSTLKSKRCLHQSASQASTT